MKIPIELDRSASAPLTAQLAEQLGQLIRTRRIPAGTRLPSSRTLAEQLGVARNTVVHAYETLSIEGLVESRLASGFFATPDQTSAALQPVSAEPGPGPGRGTIHGRPPPAPVVVSARQRINATRDLRFCDFVPGRPNADFFPVKIWRRLLQGRLSYGGSLGMSEHGDAAGLPALRAAIAEHVSVSRGIVTDPGQVLVVGGIQEALSLTARMLVKPGAIVVTEDPCYREVGFVFAGAGARLVGVPVDEDGLVTADLPEAGAALLCLTPAHQYPMGHALSPERRAQAIAWARRVGCYIVEDDYDSAYQYDGSPMQAMAGTAQDCTIHLGTFSTTLGAGLRLGYMILPPRLVDAARASKTLLNSGSSWLDQAALAELIRTGCYRAHLTRTLAAYRERRDALVASLRRYFGGVRISGEAAGLHLSWRLPAGVPEAARLEELALAQRVRVYSLTSAAALHRADDTVARRSLVLGFSGLTPGQIDQGIARLSDVVDDTLDTHHDFLRELLLDDPPPARPRAGRLPRRQARAHLQRHSALRTVAPAKVRSRRDSRQQEIPMPVVRGIYRYPIKGLSPQRLLGVVLEEGKPFPFDRVFALARPGVPIDVSDPRWAKKGLFLMLMLDEALASVQTNVDVETTRLTVWGQPAADEGAARGEPLLTADLGSDEGRRAVEEFFFRQVPELPAAPTLVRSREGHFMDKPDSVVSCINLATVRSLEERWGVALDPLRFRANFYIDGAKPWEEFEWVGSDIMLGDVLFRVDRRNGRCGATNVNPATGARDLDIPGSLRASFGHKDLGIYLVVRNGGKVVVGDQVTVPELKGAADARAAPSAPRGTGTFICRGCYFIYDESKGAAGLPPGTLFAQIDAAWRCPDCGTDKAKFRPYLPTA